MAEEVDMTDPSQPLFKDVEELTKKYNGVGMLVMLIVPDPQGTWITKTAVVSAKEKDTLKVMEALLDPLFKVLRSFTKNFSEFTMDHLMIRELVEREILPQMFGGKKDEVQKPDDKEKMS
jgi:hypothetical protein